ncbi:MAG: 30S ribosomal protein S12 methylthiotransferase RimO [Candidatus Cloacimonetes bacterium]|jgi:ribosomal protein S12 methylthiotransferase|nr:30S ribosomal protein S12 methylthiotransferase RimO [Candidatus Cloacimonadota bacterium]MBT6994427.1 30S ribosomal protein S12 methylthiotransferase RimO [Candidatus Cloacimonadota bacterium]MBT7469009.1 30S ribosomal protein S12 methylthiotransferase RimO [Candidatus Cloacimonadota bacterium]
MKKYAIISLGCPKNLVDSEVFANIIDKSGFEQTENLEAANIIIVNTCGFILDAKDESVQTILEMAAYKNSGKCEKLIVTGCLIKRYFDEIKENLPEIDYLVNLKDFDTFAEIFSTQPDTSRKLLTLPHFAYIRISDGCNNRCAYCAIPDIRGNLQSVPIEKLVKEVKYLANLGVKELIVTAQDTTQYGIDIYGSQKLSELLREFHKIEGIEWIRLLYLHPAHISSEIIDTIATSPKICKYFEIPLQHINDNILQNMNRKVTKKRIKQILLEIRQKIPNAIIRTTFIVGYPNETAENFTELKEFIQAQKFERLGIFTYSKEEDTPAFSQKNQVNEETAENRKDELMAIQQEISQNFLESLVGTKIKVIIDRISDEDDFAFEARSYFDAPEIDGIVFITNGNAKVGDIMEVEIIDAWEYDLIGEITQ